MSRKALVPSLLALASLAMATGCERALPPDPPANLEKAQEIRAELLGEEPAEDESASTHLPRFRHVAISLREAKTFAFASSTGLGPRFKS